MKTNEKNLSEKESAYGQKIKSYLTKKLAVVAALALSVGMIVPAFDGGVASAASGACSAPATDYGTVTGLSVTTSGATTHIWSRMAIPDTTNDSYLLEIDNASDSALDCYTVSAGSGAVYASGATEHFNDDSSNWVDTSVPASGTGSLPAGTYHVKLIGNAPNVLVDRLIFAQDSCAPTGTGQNCSDTIKPDASVTAPTEGQTVSGTITLKAHATDNIGVARVEFYLDKDGSAGTLYDTVYSGTSGDYTTTLDTTTLSNGAHDVAAEAFDAAGNYQGTSWIDFTVDNTLPPEDTTPPTVSFPSLSDGATLNNNSTGAPYDSSDYSVDVSANDASGINNVMLKIGSTSIGTDSSGPYTFSVDLTGLSCGDHTFTATATDNSSNSNSNNTSADTYVTYQGDMNNNCAVDFSDIGILSTKYNDTTGLGRADVNGDGQINYIDIGDLSSDYGKGV